MVELKKASGRMTNLLDRKSKVVDYKQVCIMFFIKNRMHFNSVIQFWTNIEYKSKWKTC